MASTVEELILRISGDSGGGQQALSDLLAPLTAVKDHAEALSSAHGTLSQTLKTLGIDSEATAISPFPGGARVTSAYARSRGEPSVWTCTARITAPS